MLGIIAIATTGSFERENSDGLMQLCTQCQYSPIILLPIIHASPIASISTFSTIFYLLNTVFPQYFRIFHSIANFSLTIKNSAIRLSVIVKAASCTPSTLPETKLPTSNANHSAQNTTMPGIPSQRNSFHSSKAFQLNPVVCICTIKSCVLNSTEECKLDLCLETKYLHCKIQTVLLEYINFTKRSDRNHLTVLLELHLMFLATYYAQHNPVGPSKYIIQ